MRNKKIISTILAIGILVSGTDLSYKSDAKTQLCKKTYNYIIMGDGRQDVSSIIEDCIQVKDTIEEENVAVVKMTEQEASNLAQGNCVIVEKDSEITASTKKAKSSIANTDWNIKAIRANKKKGQRGNRKQAKIKVAVIDSGIDNYNDIELADSINLIPGEENVSPMYQDISGHGSSVAGIIAAQDNGEGITGIAPEAEIYSAKVLDENNRSKVSRVIDAIYWAIDNKVNIINMSFGTPTYSYALHQAIQDAKKAGILLIAAAGNDQKCEYPAAYPEVMAVGATNKQGEISDSSATGEELEIVAPGEEICSTGAFGGTIIANGTSMSVPHITGIAVKLWEKDKNMSADFIRQLLDVSANKLTNKNQGGYGLVDYSYAQKVYHTFKKQYEDGTTLESNIKNIEANTAQIQQFDDVNYAEGRWEKADHKNLGNTAVSIAGGLTSTELKIVKLGLVAQDNYLVYNKSDSKTEKNKTFHGYNNYVNAYAYVMGMALKCRKNGLSTAKKISYPNKDAVDNADCANIKNAITESLIKKVLGNNYTYNAKNAALVLLGMSMHIVSDTYAHRSYVPGTPYWKHITQEGGADNRTTNNGKARYKAAGYAVGEVLAIWNGNCRPSFEEYDLIGIYNHSNLFRLIDYNKYASRTENGISYTAYASNVKKLSCKFVSTGKGTPE